MSDEKKMKLNLRKGYYTKGVKIGEIEYDENGNIIKKEGKVLSKKQGLKTKFDLIRRLSKQRKIN